MLHMKRKVNNVMLLYSAEEGSPLKEWFRSLRSTLESSGKKVSEFRLEDTELKFCRGCFDCWVRTPGRCVFTENKNDSGGELLSHFLNADLVLMGSDVKAGFVSWKIRRVHERMLPSLLPYIGFHKGESHHEIRSEKNPLLGLVLGIRETDLYPDPESVLERIRGFYRRLALNYRTELSFFSDSLKKPEEAAYEAAGC